MTGKQNTNKGFSYLWKSRMALLECERTLLVISLVSKWKFYSLLVCTNTDTSKK